AVNAAQLKEADADRVNASTQTSLNEDQNFYSESESLHKNLPPALQTYIAATEPFTALLTQIAESPDGTVKTDEFFAAGMKARDASFSLWKVDVNELDLLLQKRIAAYNHSKMIAFSLTGLAVVAAG